MRDRWVRVCVEMGLLWTKGKWEVRGILFSNSHRPKGADLAMFFLILHPSKEVSEGEECMRE